MPKRAESAGGKALRVAAAGVAAACAAGVLANVLVFSLLLLVLPARGCTAREATAEQDTFFAYQAGTAPSAHQREVALGLGYSEEDLAGMEDGMSQPEWYAIVPAEYMVDAMEERYGTRFEPTDITSPGFGLPCWQLECTVGDGELEGDEVSVKLAADGSHMEDTYYGALRSEEYSEEMAGAIGRAMAEQRIPEGDYVLDAEAGPYVDHAQPLSGSMRGAGGIWYLYAKSPKGLKKKGVGKLADSIAQSLRESGYEGSLFLHYIPAFPDGFEMTLSRAQEVYRLSKSSGKAAYHEVRNI